MEQRRDYDDTDTIPDSDRAAAGLDLVERTAELIRTTENNAAEVVARSQAAVAHLQEEMRLAERVLEAAETRRRAAEAEVKELKQRLDEHEQTAAERIESLNKRYQERIDNLSADLLASQMLATQQEERAIEAENALNRIQTAMQGILKVRAND